MSKRSPLKSLGIFLLPGLLLSCSNAPHRDDVIARINGKPITVKEYQNLYEALKPRDLTRPGREAFEMKNLAIKTLVRRQAILTEADRRNIVVTDQELEQRIKKIKEGYTPESFQESLIEMMVNEKEWKEQVRQNLLIEKIFEASDVRKPSPRLEEALAYYEKNPTLFHQKATAVAYHIVVPQKELSEDLRRKLLATPSKFQELAKAHSTGPEAQIDAKIQIEKDALPEMLDRALFESPLGSLSPVIPSPYGFHLLKVVERKPAINKDFEQVKVEILKRLENEQRQIWLLRFEEDLLRSAQIEYNRSLIRKL